MDTPKTPAAPAASPPTPPPALTGGKLVLATIAVALATFMNVLDSSIANVAIPTISGNLGVSVDEGTWVITLFAAANAVSIPLTGWLTQRMGQIKLFVIAILLFVLSSWLCGLAPTLPILLAARILQGAVAGPLIPLSQAILLSSYPKAKSGLALSLWAMTATVGPIAGPALGAGLLIAIRGRGFSISTSRSACLPPPSPGPSTRTATPQPASCRLMRSDCCR